MLHAPPPHLFKAVHFHGDYLGNEATVEECFLLVGPWKNTTSNNIGEDIFHLVCSKVIDREGY
jgi:hypothetical protein